MNIALILQHRLLLGIQRFLAGSSGPAAAAPLVSTNHGLARAVSTVPRSAGVAALHRASAAPAGHRAQKVMPLRVLRVVESGQPRSCSGRLVISGRMADVCAELDRLVEREAALH
jgi:hypothetical protein